MSIRNLDKMFRPRSIAVIGASDKPNSVGSALMTNLLRAGYAIELKAHSHGRYSTAEREARDAKRGLWAGTFERPSEWRQRTAR